jgi:DNA (cytosine-5)-methyltransferase 1
MAAYYNEIEPYAAAWLRNLIAAGHIAPGEVDTRSIVEVKPDDLRGFTQCHFFAGIGVWSYALRRAGWADDRPVWTGSCPCQPFSTAGKRRGHEDERHLWPTWFRLIRECRPVAIFGEQVANGDGAAWLDHVATDLEGDGYAVGAVSAPACGFGAPHIRQRLYWMADSANAGHERRRPSDNLRGRESNPRNGGELGHPDEPRPQGRRVPEIARGGGGDGQLPAGSPGPVNGFWADAEWLPCRDGKARPTQPGLFPLAHGAPARVGRLRAYGNAINAAQAEEFVRAAMERAA